MGLDIKKLADQRYTELKERQQRLIQRWAPLLSIVEESFQKKGKTLSMFDKANIAQCLQNAFDYYVTSRKQPLQEETTTSDVAFAKTMLPVIPALLPSLVANEVAVVQAIDRPTAGVYLMNVKAATTKGSVNAGDVLIGAKTGPSAATAARYYASDTVAGETIGTGNGSATTFSGTAARKPIIPGSIRIKYTIGGTTYSGHTAATDDGSGSISGEHVSGTINYETGAYSLTFDTAPDNGTSIEFEVYRFNVEKDTSGIGGADIEIVEEVVQAEVFPIRIDFSVLAQLLMQRVHGIALESEAVKFATQMVRFAIDQKVLDQALWAATSSDAADPIGEFTVTPGQGQEYIWRINEIKRYISKGAANIFAKTLRATGNVIVGGVNFCAMLEILTNNGFKPALAVGTRPPAGPYVFGTLDNRTVICNPFYDANTYVVLFRGDSYLFAGLVYAPFIPFYATPAVTLATLKTQQGFFSQGGIKIINYGMYTYGTIAGF